MTWLWITLGITAWFVIGITITIFFSRIAKIYERRKSDG